MIKKVLKIVALVLVLLVATAIILPFVFKDKIIAMVKEEANKNLNATLAFDDINISLFAHFPKLSIELENLSIAGKDAFKGDTLVAAKSLGISTGLMGLFGDQIEIGRVWLSDGQVNLKVLADGKANWDITLPDSSSGTAEPSESSAFKAKLQGYSLDRVSLVYDDQSMGFYTAMKGLNHSGSGDFTADQTNLDTETSIDSWDLSYEGVMYLKNAKVKYDAQFALDLKNSKYSFLENQFQLNDLMLKFSGYVAMPGDDIQMDIQYAALQNEVKNFISLIPGSFTADFADVKSSGKLDFNGFVKGIYNEKSIPGFAFNLNIENGSVQYPGLPRSLSKIQVKTAITCPGVDADRTIVDVSKFHVDLGQFPIDAGLVLKTPISDPDIAAFVKGRVDLGTLKDVLPLDEGMKLQGVLTADASFAGRMSSIEKEDYAAFKASGNALLERFNYSAPDLAQDVNISEAAMNFNPKSIELSRFSMTSGKSDLQARGILTNYIAYALKDEAIQGKLQVSSRFFDVNPWMTTTEETAPAEASGAPQDVSGYVRVPNNVDFNLQANFAHMIYDNLDLKDISGALIVKNEQVVMQGVQMKTLGGAIRMSGLYDTKEQSGPSVALDLNLDALGIKESAKTFSTVKQLAPIAENTIGTVSVSNFHFSCKADEAFNPIMKTVNGSGQLSTSPIVIEGFEMVKQIAATLKLDKLKSWKLEPLKAEFSIIDGTVNVKPFKTKIGGIPAEIGGQNGLDQSINYQVNLEIPRSEFGGAANGVLNSMVSRASGAGVNVNLGETIPVAVKVTGTFAQPKVSTDIKSKGSDAMNDLKDQAEAKLREEADRRKKELEDKAKAEKDRLQQEAMDKVNSEKARLQQEADKAKKEAERKAKEEADKAKKKAEEEAKKGLQNLLKKK